ncbi:MAG: acetate--CoA ligase family protein [Acidobacteriota bacterium]
MSESPQAILAPRAIAVVGVSSRAESLSGRLLGNLFSAGYTGAIYPVNPKVAALRGLRCFASVGAIPDPIDLAIVMVPRDAVAGTVDECIAAGVHGLVVITAGFREGGEVGVAAERAVLARVRAAGVRMLGPNCMGVINTAPDVRLDATFSPVPALPGGVAFASHSGALGVALLELAQEAGLGFSQFVSLGNSADLNVCDLLEVWEHHEPTRVIMLYLEAIEEPRRFLELARRIARRKPIVTLKAGRGAAGQRAACSHTGALAVADTAVDAVLKQAGVLRASTLEEMFDLARALAVVPLPPGRRVAIVTNAGGPAIAASDALERQGLALADLAAGTCESLRAFLPAEASVGNPVDMLPSATADNYRTAIGLVAGDPGVDAIVTVTVTPIVVGPHEIAAGIAAAAPAAGKTVLSVFMTDPRFHRAAGAIPGLPPTFRFPEAAVAALAGMARQTEGVARPADEAPPLPPPSPLIAGAAAAGRGSLTPDEAFGLLAEIGIPVAPHRVVTDPSEVAGAADAVGFPVVLKAFGERLVHKSELGAVVTDLRDEREVHAALRALESRLERAGAGVDGFLVQRQVRGGREVIIGLVRDPVAGPLVMCGLGGVAVEVMRDVAFRLAPVTAADAAGMLDELRGAGVLGSFRGRPAADRGALIAALVALGRLAAANPAIAECDVNPLLVLDAGQGCVAVDVRFRLAG